MCEPVTIATIGIAAFSAIAQHQQQAAAADATERFQNERFAQTQANANASFLEQAGRINLRIGQEEEAASAELHERNVEALRAASTAKVSAGESGVSGLSVNALLSDIFRSDDKQSQAVVRNIEFIRDQSEADIKGLQAQAVNRTVAVLPEPVSRPSAFATGLKIAGSTAGALSAGGFFDGGTAPALPDVNYRQYARSYPRNAF